MKRPLIAVVDDEKDLLENFQSFLEIDYEVHTFSSPQDFLKALPDLLKRGLRLLISDYKMPGMTGLEMIQKAYQVEPQLPFVILSGFLDKKTVIEAVELGVFKLLEKPCPPEDLIAAIDQLLLESELSFTRKEIHQITSQLRELYSAIRIALMQHLPAEWMDRLVLDASEGDESRKLSFDELLENLEQRLDQLLTSEKVINELKGSRLKTGA